LGRRPALDGVRGLAFAMVLAGHAGWPLARTRAHELGVELFFVLSGFLITALLLEEQLAKGRVALGRFYWRRLRRLVPALVAVVGATLLVASWTNLLDWGGSRRGAIGGLTYASNIVRIHGWDLGPLGHLWSLSVEEHFYIVWPAVLLVALAAARRAARPWIVLAVPIAFAGLCFAWRVWLVARGSGDDLNTRLYYPTDTRVLGPLAGCALAVIKVHGPQLGLAGALEGRTAARLGGAGLVVLAWLATGPAITDRPTMFVAGLPLATLAGIGICAACATTPNPVAGLLEARPLRWLGAVSYGGYLAHYPIYFAFGYELTGMSTSQAITVITLSLVAAAVIERFVERPFRSHPTAPADVPLAVPDARELASASALSAFADAGMAAGRIGPV
jgi:peptidoglycan/LPS O-acetylase OafA/YrhL